MGGRPKLFDFNAERASIIDVVSQRTIDGKVRAADAGTGPQLEYILNEAAYQEIERLVKYGADEEIGEVGSLSFWRGVARRVGSAGEGEKRRLLSEIVRSYAADVAGNFDPRVYQFSSRVLPVALSGLFNAQGLQSGEGFRRLTDRIRIEGPLEKLRRLVNLGTVVVAPTHLSNLDSPVIGWALYEAGLPPVTYGAGKNLFTNPLLSFFMRNVGAYRVDRRIRHGLYKDCLKRYSEELLLRGFHSLFFPGGTRSRSGAVESRLKLGLLGTALTATLRMMRAQQERPIFIVPMTLNFSLVLEAEGLFNDYMRSVGRENYLLPDDPFDSPWEVARFVTKLAGMETSAVVRFGEPMDVLGHAVDEEGESYDSRGRRVDLRTFFEVSPGEIGRDFHRDREYTRETGESLMEALRSNTVLMPTQFVSYVLFEAARRRYPKLDLARVLRFGRDVHVPWDEVNAEAGKVHAELKALSERGKIRLDGVLRHRSVPEIIDLGLRDLSHYHVVTAAEATGQGVRLNNMNLLGYYGNRPRCVLEVGGQR